MEQIKKPRAHKNTNCKITTNPNTNKRRRTTTRHNHLILRQQTNAQRNENNIQSNARMGTLTLHRVTTKRRNRIATTTATRTNTTTTNTESSTTRTREEKTNARIRNAKKISNANARLYLSKIL